MKLCLASFLHPKLNDFLHGRVLFIDDASTAMAGAPFVEAERQAVADVASEFITFTVANAPLEKFQEELAQSDVVYVASGNVFQLLGALESTGADKALIDTVRSGLPYCGSSAGAILAGPSIEPATVMDEPDALAAALNSYTGLGLTDYVVVPHAQGTTGPYTIDIISETVRRYGMDFKLVLLHDGQALLIDEDNNKIL